VTCRFFEDPFNGKQYLVSADRKYQVKVWDLTDDGKMIFDRQVEEKYDNFIYSVLMVFEKDKIYVLASTLGNGETIVYTMGKEQETRKLKDTRELSIYYLDYWFEESDDNGKPEHHIIQLGKSNILVSQLNKDLNYVIKINDEKYANVLCGMVFKKGDRNLLIVSSTRGLIQVIDLKEKEEAKRVIYTKEYPDVFFYNFVRWNEKYILLYEALQRRILILDSDNEYKIISKVLCPEMYFDRFIRKVDHPKYGESILSVGIDWKIKLYTNRNIIKEDEEEKGEKEEEEKGEEKKE
jgi:WD40 repeat protein